MIAELEALYEEADRLHRRICLAHGGHRQQHSLRDERRLARLWPLIGRARTRAERRYGRWQAALDRQAEDATAGLAEFMADNPHL